MALKPLLIDGEPVVTEEVLSVKSPWTGDTIGECCRAGPAEVALALETGHAAARAMRGLKNYQRADILHRAANKLAAGCEEFAKLIALEGGKPIRESRAEATRAESTFRLAAEAARSWGGDLLPLDITPAGGERIALVRRFPVGLVTGISPFNFPLNLVAHKVAPAIAAGCAINLKPSSLTPLSALRLGELLLDCGLPAGACNVIPMQSKFAGPLIEDPRVKLVTFTGSAAVGWGLKKRAVKQKVCLELGGNAAVIVEPDCDLERALTRTLIGGYAHTGQVCISVQHVLVQERLYPTFLERFIDSVKRLTLGDPLNESTEITAMIEESEARRVEEWIHEALQRGATLHCGGERNGSILTPAVLSSVPADSRLSAEEAFGPVTVFHSYKEFADALDQVNSWKFGLQTGIFTRDIRRAMIGYERLDVGSVIIDDVPTLRVDNYPYGGIKESGFGREGVRYAMEEMSELKTLVLPAPK